MADPIDWGAWFERRDEIFDDIHAGEKRRKVEEALDDLYAVQYAPALAERDELKAEAERLRARLQRSDELLVDAHNDLCQALGIRHVTFAEAVGHAAAIRAEHDRIASEAEQSRATAHGLGRDYRQARAQVQRVRDAAAGLHKASVHQPDECVRDCPGCTIARALDGGCEHVGCTSCPGGGCGCRCHDPDHECVPDIPETSADCPGCTPGA